MSSLPNQQSGARPSEQRSLRGSLFGDVYECSVAEREAAERVHRHRLRADLSYAVEDAISWMIATSRTDADGEPIETPTHRRARRRYERLRRLERQRETRSTKPATRRTPAPAVRVARARSRRSRPATSAKARGSADSDGGEPPPRVRTSYAAVDDPSARGRAVDIIKQLMERAEGRR